VRAADQSHDVGERKLATAPDGIIEFGRIEFGAQLASAPVSGFDLPGSQRSAGFVPQEPELDLDVVGISKGDHRADRCLGGRGVGDTELVELLRPFGERTGRVDPDGDVIEPRVHLIARITRTMPSSSVYHSAERSASVTVRAR
jgi:hypothetical protein